MTTLPDKLVVRVGRTRVTLDRSRSKLRGVHAPTGLDVIVELTAPRDVWGVKQPVPDDEKWTAEVGGYRKDGPTPQKAVNDALALRRAVYQRQLDGAVGSIVRCEKALAQARRNAPRRIAELTQTLEALR